MLALNARCSDDTASWTRASKLGRAGLTGKAEEGAMRGCLSDLGGRSSLGKDVLVVGEGSVYS